uniref:AAA-type ATPase N-terminal domain-containing protein n=1 Tax=Aegilops tauschii subsp. strangulata TaxID=200361 RepID=A0A453FW72_AEGTS
RRLLPFLDPFVTIDIAAKPEDYSFSYQGKVKSSDAYAEVLAYLSAVCSREARELRAEGAAEGHGFVLSLREGQVVADDFKGVTISWSAVAEEKTTWRASGRCCRLTFHERHRRLVVDEYLPHVRRAGQEVMFGNRPRRLYSNKKELSYQYEGRGVELHRLRPPNHLRHPGHGPGQEADDNGRPRRLQQQQGLLPPDRQGLEARLPPPRPAGNGQVHHDRRHGQLPQVRHLRHRAHHPGDQQRPSQALHRDHRQVHHRHRGHRLLHRPDRQPRHHAAAAARARRRRRGRLRQVGRQEAQHPHAVRPPQLHRRALVGAQRRAHHRLYHQPPRQAGPGADPAGPHGHAHRDVLLRVRGVQDAGE